MDSFAVSSSSCNNNKKHNNNSDDDDDDDKDSIESSVCGDRLYFQSNSKKAASHQNSHHGSRRKNRHGGSHDDDNRNTRNPRNSSAAVFWSKMAVCAVLILSTLAVALGVYLYLSRAQQDQFEAQFTENVQKVFGEFGSSLDEMLGATDNFVTNVVSYSKLASSSSSLLLEHQNASSASTSTSTWPFVTVPDFAVKAAKLRSLTKSLIVGISPIVYEEDRVAWEEYAAAHNGWVDEGLRVQKADTNFRGTQLDTWTPLNVIHGNTGPIAAPAHRAYIPTWQQAPLVPRFAPYAWDMNAYFQQELDEIRQSCHVVIGYSRNVPAPDEPAEIPPDDHTVLWAQGFLGPDQDATEPITAFHYPIVPHATNAVFVPHDDDNNDDNDDNDEDDFNHNRTAVVGIASVTIFWRELLQDILPPGSNGIDIVIGNTWNQSFTYRIMGPTVEYLGPGNRHHTAYDYLEYQSTFDELKEFAIRQRLYTGFPLSPTLGQHWMRAYPSNLMYADYVNQDPLWFTLLVVLIFCFTSAVFVVYAYFVGKEFHAKTELLDAKRQFVRFISHEVRTPLNTVSMGLNLLQREIESARIKEDDEHGDLDQAEDKKNAVALQPQEEQQETAATLARIRQNQHPNVSHEELKDWLDLTQMILKSTYSSVDVLNDILNYDKILAGKLNLELTPIAIWKVIQRTAAEFDLPFMQKNITFRVQHRPNGTDTTPLRMLDVLDDFQQYRIVGDVVRITQVLRNLISNALKFTPESGTVIVESAWRQPTHTLKETPFRQRKREEGSMQQYQLADGRSVTYNRVGLVEVSVIDTGAGLSEDQLSDLFTEGLQFNVNKLQGGQGSGLGLHISKGIVEQHGGRVSVSSRGLGRGTTFTLQFPLLHIPGSNETSGETSETSSIKAEMLSSLQCRKLRVLVVDDVSSNRLLVVRFLERQGHSCDQAQNGQEAVTKVTQAMSTDNPFDCVLLDYEMPVLNGPQAAEAMRHARANVFIIGITGNLLPEDVEYFQDCGADRVLPKPFHLPDLEDIWAQNGFT